MFLQYEELWEGEEIVYKCKNETLVINNNPDHPTIIITNILTTTILTTTIITR